MPSFLIDRAMFLALHQQPSDVDAFLFVLAEKFRTPVHVIRDWPAAEIAYWAAYYKVRSAQREVERW